MDPTLPGDRKPVSEIVANDILETIPSALIILDRHLNITVANRAFYQIFRTTPAATEGRHIFELGNRQWDIPALRTLLERVIPHRTSVEGFEVEHAFPLIGQRTMLVNARKVFQPGDHDGAILLAIEDVSIERAAMAESRRNWQLAQSIIDTIRDPLVVLEQDLTIVTASKAFCTLFGVAETAARGLRLSELGQHQWDVPALRHLMEKVLPENRPIEGFEIEDDFPNLGRRVFNLRARKIQQAGNHVTRMLIVFEDITERKQRERDALSLTSEISHRIKNNLQIIVSLIAFEARSTAQPCVQGYQAMQARIGSIARLYDLLSQTNLGSTLALDHYLRDIAKALSASLLGEGSSVEIDVKAEPLEIDADRAVPFGLLVNELATNAVKHAFPDGAGRVTLSLERRGTHIALTIADDGVGVSEPLPKSTQKRGADYIDIFVRQLGGVIESSRPDEPGTAIRVRFPFAATPRVRAA